MKTIIKAENLKVFFMGIFATVAIGFLMGAGGESRETGRYQLAGTANDMNTEFLIIDTATGRTKQVLFRHRRLGVLDQLDTPFDEIDAKAFGPFKGGGAPYPRGIQIEKFE
jgi:hypothetical protein